MKMIFTIQSIDNEKRKEENCSIPPIRILSPAAIIEGLMKKDILALSEEEEEFIYVSMDAWMSID